MSVEVQVECAEIIARLDPNRLTNDLVTTMRLAEGLVHRTLMSLSREGTPPDEQGILPVVKGGLKGSFEMADPEWHGNDLAGAVATNIAYGYRVNRRRQFVERASNLATPGVNDLFAARASNF